MPKTLDELFDTTHSNLEPQTLSLEAFEAFKVKVMIHKFQDERVYFVFTPDWTEDDIVEFYEPLGYTREQVQEMICG